MNDILGESVESLGILECVCAMEAPKAPNDIHLCHAHRDFIIAGACSGNLGPRHLDPRVQRRRPESDVIVDSENSIAVVVDALPHASRLGC